MTVDEVTRGDPGASRRAFERYVVPEIPVLYRVAVSLTGQRADAEDLVQDTLIRAYGAVDRFDGAYPRSWLLTILRRTHLNRVRRKLPVLLAEDEASSSVGERLERMAPTSPSAEDEAVRGEFGEVVARCLRALPEKHRSVVTLVDVRGLSYQEAADVLGVPRGTVMSRLHRARKKIRAELAAAGLAPRGGNA